MMRRTTLSVHRSVETLARSSGASAAPIPDDDARLVAAPTTVSAEEIAANFQRIGHQVRLIRRLVEEERSCEEVLRHLGVVIAATRRVGLLILEDCVDTHLAHSAGAHETAAQLKLVIECLTGRSQRS